MSFDNNCLLSTRSYGPLLEITRCLIYFALDYFIIQKNPWPIHDNEYVFFYNFMWLVRTFHAASMLFWIAKCTINHEAIYIVQKTVTNQIKDSELGMKTAEAENDNQKKDVDNNKHWHVFFTCFGLALATVTLTVAWALQVDECADLYKTIIDKLYN